MHIISRTVNHDLIKFNKKVDAACACLLWLHNRHAEDVNNVESCDLMLIHLLFEPRFLPLPVDYFTVLILK